MRQLRGIGVVLGLLSSAAACAEYDAGAQGQRLSSVEADQRDVYYDFAFRPVPALESFRSRADAGMEAGADGATDAGAGSARAEWARELAAQALPYWSSGAITVPARDDLGEPLLAPLPAESRIRYSCGATLISPSYVITAGHCVTPDSALHELELHLYRATDRLADVYEPPALTGAWPLFEHPSIAEADGYLQDVYSCEVVTRCYSDTQTADCPDVGSDVALLRCDGYPGDSYGFLNVRMEDPAGAEALMHWKHEVYDVPSTLTSGELFEHYVNYGPVEGNYHYFETGNQLVPLKSIPWGPGRPTTFVSSFETDVLGCHGSSGSGILMRVGDTAEYRLAGPAAVGYALAGRLCHAHVSGTGETGPGRRALGIDWPDPSSWLAPWQEAIDADCATRRAPRRDVEGLPVEVGEHRPSTLFGHLRCQIDPFARDGAVEADPVFGPYPERFVDASSGAEHVMSGFELGADADYRFGVQAMALSDCDGDCGAVQLRVGADAVDVEPPASSPSLVVRFLPSVGEGPVELGVSSSGQARALGGLVLIREGQFNTFDAPEDRLEAALYDIPATGAPVGPFPMRFVGDGSVGYAALLRPGERMALLRQAIGEGRSWTVRLGAASSDELSCGLLDVQAQPVKTEACAGLVRIDDSQGTQARLGFFVELAASATQAVTLSYVALASDAARDLDEDAVPDVLDNCPSDWNPSQGSCDEQPPAVQPEAGDAGLDGGAFAFDDASSAVDGAFSDAPAVISAVDAGSDRPSEASATNDAPDAVTPDGQVGGVQIDTPPLRNSDSGCGCRLPGRSRSSSDSVAWLLLGVALLIRRRRGRARARPIQRGVPRRLHVPEINGSRGRGGMTTARRWRRSEKR